jgi:hypothetical protein
MERTFIANMSYSQEPGYNFKKLPKSAREFSCFLDLIIEDTLKNLPDNFTPTYICCNKRGCHGIISTKIDFDEDTIQWECSACPTGGTITNLFESSGDHIAN